MTVGSSSTAPYFCTCGAWPLGQPYDDASVSSSDRPRCAVPVPVLASPAAFSPQQPRSSRLACPRCRAGPPPVVPSVRRCSTPTPESQTTGTGAASVSGLLPFCLVDLIDVCHCYCERSTDGSEGAGRGFQLHAFPSGTDDDRRAWVKDGHRQENAMLSRLPSRSGRGPGLPVAGRTCERCKGASHIWSCSPSRLYSQG